MRMLHRGVELTAAGLACVVVSVSMGFAPALATPGDGQTQTSCAFPLSPPFVVEMSGVEMVSATLGALPCTGVTLPNQQTVCVELQGGGSAPQCAYVAGYGTAQVYFAPYRQGSTYVSTGTGCAAVPPTQTSVCATRGPLSAAL